MKRKLSLLFLSVLSIASIYAQSPKAKGAEAITKRSVQSQITFLADDLLEGRDAGMRGGMIAASYIASVLHELGIEPLYETGYFQRFEAIQNPVEGARPRYFIDEVKIKELQNDTLQPRQMKNILGYIEGVKKDEYVVVGAHYDHLGIINDSIYNGADDNASGVAAVLQIAKGFVASGQKPERTVIFALWDGEEKGLLGSSYFVNHTDLLPKIKGYMNFDMIGRNTDENNPTHVDYFYTEANPEFEKWQRMHIEEFNLNLTPTYRPWDNPVGGSDNASFAKHQIPIIWYHTNAHPDYHKPGDEAYKINWDKAVDIIKSSYLNMWEMANNPTYSVK
ncbi:MAG: M28 family metallopeptidase [Tannerellaceae bacterium]